MKGYRVVLPPKTKGGEVLTGGGLKVFDPSGHEITHLIDFSFNWHAGDFATLTMEVPVSVVEHEEPEPEQKVLGENPKDYDDLSSGPQYREYGDLS